jgi:hypothetical protein
VAVLHTRSVATKQSGTLFDVALAEIACFAEFSQSVPDYHARDITASSAVFSIVSDVRRALPVWSVFVEPHLESIYTDGLIYAAALFSPNFSL